MIDFAVNDRTDYIERILNKLNEFNKIDVLIVDTNSNNNNVIDFYNMLDKNKFNYKIYFDRVETDCYDSGAYIHSFKKYKSDFFYFFQDSIEFINEDIFNDINKLLNIYDVVALSPFPLLFDNKEQVDWITSNLPISEIMKVSNRRMYGIFGPMFFIKRKTLEKIPDNWLVYPTIKNQAMAMERKWSIMFNILDFKTVYLESDHMEFLSSQHPNKYINKTMLARQ